MYRFYNSVLIPILLDGNTFTIQVYFETPETWGVRAFVVAEVISLVMSTLFIPIHTRVHLPPSFICFFNFNHHTTGTITWGEDVNWYFR